MIAYQPYAACLRGQLSSNVRQRNGSSTFTWQDQRRCRAVGSSSHEAQAPETSHATRAAGFALVEEGRCKVCPSSLVQAGLALRGRLPALGRDEDLLRAELLSSGSNMLCAWVKQSQSSGSASRFPSLPSSLRQRLLRGVRGVSHACVPSAA